MKTVLKSFFVRHMAAIMIGCLIIAVLIITGGMVNSIRKNIDEFSIITPPREVETEKALYVSVGEQYVVREYDGRIGVFLSGDTHPIRIVQVYVIYLPESDRVRLREGITVSGNTRLENLLSDFSS